jgi:hypothetical protein
MIEWQSMRNGLMLTPCVATFGGIAFILASIFIIQDRRQTEVLISSRLIHVKIRSLNMLTYDSCRLTIEDVNGRENYGLEEAIKSEK